jgi:hypothetical protein
VISDSTSSSSSNALDDEGLTADYRYDVSAYVSLRLLGRHLTCFNTECSGQRWLHLRNHLPLCRKVAGHSSVILAFSLPFEVRQFSEI